MVSNSGNESVNERKYTRRLCVSQSTYDLIMIDCKNALLEERPDFTELNITQNFMVNRIGKRYMKL